MAGEMPGRAGLVDRCLVAPVGLAATTGLGGSLRLGATPHSPGAHGSAAGTPELPWPALSVPGTLSWRGRGGSARQGSTPPAPAGRSAGPAARAPSRAAADGSRHRPRRSAGRAGPADRRRRRSTVRAVPAAAARPTRRSGPGRPARPVRRWRRHLGRATGRVRLGGLTPTGAGCSVGSAG
ncbi:hypothetical protein NKG94_35290 [Micromonospora sp. M12]